MKNGEPLNCCRLSNLRGSAGLFVALLGAGIVMAAADGALAQNSLGLGRPEPAITPEGPFAGFLFWIQQQQKEFYRLMTEALRAIRSGEGGAWILAGLSFAYGVLHAAGPGHGKVVISSYMVANEVQLRRGIVLSFASSALQALVAIAAIGLLVLGLQGLGVRQSDMTRNLEIASYLGVTLLGVWLLWRKAVQPLFQRQTSGHLAHAHVNSSAGHHHAAHHHHGHAHHRHDHGAHGHHQRDHHQHHHDHGNDAACPECGHAHLPDPKMLDGGMGIREAWSAIIAVGLRPCTGALIVLTFAFLNGLYVVGIMSAFAMAVGTAITVSAIATLAVTAKNVALRLTTGGTARAGFYRGIEIFGAALIFLMGITLLSASLTA